MRESEPLRLTFTVRGNGPPVILLHGLFGSGRNWGRIAGALSNEFRVYAVDLRNHGASPWSDEMDYPGMAQISPLSSPTSELPQPPSSATAWAERSRWRSTQCTPTSSPGW